MWTFFFTIVIFAFGLCIIEGLFGEADYPPLQNIGIEAVFFNLVLLIINILINKDLAQIQVLLMFWVSKDTSKCTCSICLCCCMIKSVGSTSQASWKMIQDFGAPAWCC